MDDTHTPHQIFWKDKLRQLCEEAATLAPMSVEWELATLDYDTLLDKAHARIRKLEQAWRLGQNILPQSGKIMAHLRKLLDTCRAAERVVIEMRYAIRYEKGLTPEKKEDHGKDLVVVADSS